MRTFLFLFFLIFSNILIAQFCEEQIITACEVCTPTAVYSTDLNGDGHIDILFAAIGDRKIGWYENDGNGNFSEQKIIAIHASRVESVFAADIDSDGDIDVLSASRLDNTIAWYENDGNGNFSEQRIISTQATGVNNVYAADLDEDGDVDVLASAQLDNTIAWYKNDGNGNFSEEHIVLDQNDVAVFMDGVGNVYAADLDSDGDMDILFASSRGGIIAWLENDGSGNFSEQKNIYTQDNGVVDVYTGDVDGDGDMDVISASGTIDGKIAWYKNDGNGNFSKEQIISIQAQVIQSVYAADLDGDGDMDVLYASFVYNKISWYENEGNEQFSAEHIISDHAIRATDVYAADLDGNGDVEVISASAFDNKIAWYENDGSGDFSEQTIPHVHASGANSVFTNDLDGDGDMDVLSASFWDDKIAWYENDGNGQFSAENIISTQAKGATDVHAADLDGDGAIDVLSASALDNKLAWYQNDGNGNFSEQKNISTQVELIQAIYAADLDGDGAIDVLSASYDDDKIAWYQNDGNGNFSEQKIISIQANRAKSVYATDLDGDGDVDVLSASFGDDKIAWYQNDGNGNFSEQKNISTQADGARSVYATDLDGDGDMDVLSASSSFSEDKIAWYENNGNGQFSTENILPTQAIRLTDVYAIDLDGDGDADVLSASDFDNKIAWHENNGNGQFSEEKIISTLAWSARSVYATDIDRDGDMDVLSASFRDDKIAWYENFQEYPIYLKVFADNNYNCINEENEAGLIRKIQITALPSQKVQVFLPNEAGIIQKQFGATEQDTAIEVRLLVPNRINNCPSHTYPLTRNNQIKIYLPVQLENCPNLSVDIGTPFLRRCFDNIYSVSYCNNATENIDSGYIAIQLDSFFTIVDSDLSYEDKGTDQYEFSLPPVKSGNCGDFQFTINLSCESTLGQTHCVEAHAYPDICPPQSLINWSGASLKLVGTCEQGVAKFTISNEGQGAMFEQQTLIVVEDETIIKERAISLAQGASETIMLPANGATYHAFINQAPNHPGRSAPIAHIEGCGGINTTGLVNAFPKDDNDLFKAIDCQENIGAFDPNDKAATPLGLESEHYLEKNTDIVYKVRFQNTGTDTAFNIVIWDTLSTHLNATTIEAGASSHPYEFDRFQDTIAGVDRIRFTFSNIMLPDSNINEAASHGFVQFRIQQQPDLPDGTLIENEAAIYFDFNEPIFTNVVHHTIGFPLARLAVNTIEEELSKEVVTMTPNPFGDFVTVERNPSSTDALILSIFDVTGRAVSTVFLQNTIQRISTTSLGKGLYLYRVMDEEGRKIGNGKILKQ